MPLLDPEFFRVNATVFSWMSVRLLLDGIPRRRLTAISFEEKLERAKMKGAKRSGTPIGYTAGDYSVENLSVTLLPDEEIYWRQYLSLKALSPSSGKAEFSLQLQLVEGVDVITCNFQRCKLAGGKMDLAQGVEGSVVVVPLDCLLMDKNGTALYDLTRDL